MKVELTAKQVLEFVILGIKNGRYQAALNLAQDCVDEINLKSAKTVEEEKNEAQKLG